MRSGTYRAATLTVVVLVLLLCAAIVSVVQANPLPTVVTDADQSLQLPTRFDKARPVPVPIVGAPVVTLHDSMRKVWTDHCVWSRMVTMAILHDMKGCEPYEERLALNVKDVSDLLAVYYPEGAEKFMVLFEQHIAIGGQALYAIKSDDQTLFRSVVRDWYRNADEIAALFSDLNPDDWPYSEMRMMWSMHLDTVIDQALQFHKEDWPVDVAAYDAMQEHGLRMADYLSDGILHQFPEK